MERFDALNRRVSSLLEKFNPYHDAQGQFASAGGGGGGGGGGAVVGGKTGAAMHQALSSKGWSTRAKPGADYAVYKNPKVPGRPQIDVNSRTLGSWEHTVRSGYGDVVVLQRGASAASLKNYLSSSKYKTNLKEG